MTKYFLIAATKDHVLNGVRGGFAQAGHGRKNLISKPTKGDWIVYYSSKDKIESGTPLQTFTAIGKVMDEEAYQASVDPAFKPFRRKMEYRNCAEVSIRPLLGSLAFIKNKKRWGFYLMSGFREISKDDFRIISGAMGLHL